MPRTVEEKPFRRLELAEIDQDIKNATVPMASICGNDLYVMMHRLQQTRNLNKLTKLVSDLIIQFDNCRGSINGGRKSDDGS